MSIHDRAPDLELFKRYIGESRHYLEYGSGSSTHTAASFGNLRRIDTVESDVAWAAKMKRELVEVQSNSNSEFDKDARIHLHVVDLRCKPATWGMPGPLCSRDAMDNYPRVVQVLEAAGGHPDFVMVDGRFRVRCCLMVYKHTPETTLVMLDDFKERPEYNRVIKYYDIVDIGRSAVVMRKKPRTEELMHDLDADLETYKFVPQ